MKYPGITDPKEEKVLDEYSELIYFSNKKFNLTGYKTISDIQERLITESLYPFTAINVPRGTLIADIGTGAGVPGVPLSIRFKDSAITMFDATLKKIEFINLVIDNLGIRNAVAINGRMEDVGRDPVYRETFDWVTTRAMADPYTAVELGSPLVKNGGFVYLYTSEKQNLPNAGLLEHFRTLGMRMLNDVERGNVFGFTCEGMLLEKIHETDLKYPRRINAIRRESVKINPQE